MNGLDLFSGIGGLAIALSQWVRPIAYCENEPYAQAVLLSRMSDKRLPMAPIWDDIRTLTAYSLPTPIDIIYGGFPCQDLSVAGAGAGLGGERSGLYFEIERLIRETKPAFVFLENVPAIRTRGLGRVVWGLSELGYDCRWTTVSAAEVGAPHLRKRWFLLAHAMADTSSERRGEGRTESAREQGRHGLAGGSMGNTDSEGELQQSGAEHTVGRWTADTSWWAIEPDVGRVAHGVSARVDRLRGLGNAVVPLQAREAFMRLMGL